MSWTTIRFWERQNTLITDGEEGSRKTDGTKSMNPDNDVGHKVQAHLQYLPCSVFPLLA